MTPILLFQYCVALAGGAVFFGVSALIIWVGFLYVRGLILSRK
jgi:hypothetical protein